MNTTVLSLCDANTDAKVDTFLLLSQSELSLAAVGDLAALAFGGAAVTADVEARQQPQNYLGLDSDENGDTGIMKPARPSTCNSLTTKTGNATCAPPSFAWHRSFRNHS